MDSATWIAIISMKTRKTRRKQFHQRYKTVNMSYSCNSPAFIQSSPICEFGTSPTSSMTETSVSTQWKSMISSKPIAFTENKLTWEQL